MKILWINNDGGGYANDIDINEATTIAELFENKIPNAKASDYLIRVNRQPTSREYVLQAGDRVSCTPVKIEGARR
ncbi:MAG: molybdopterin converting factor [Planctomycetes bacterium]|nr:molybdopterin converting factor [Planctomycetota bacterium]